MSTRRILVVDDNGDVLEQILQDLEDVGLQVLHAISDEEALVLARQKMPDLVLLALMPPHGDPLDVCRQLKGNPWTRAIRLVILAERSEDADVVSSLELGVDGFLTRPFNPLILVARIKAELRNEKDAIPDENCLVTVGDLVVDPVRFQVRLAECRVDLTVREFKVLHLMARSEGQVFSRDQIISAVKGDDYDVTDRSVDVQIVGLRRKLGGFGRYIETVRGVGYRFKIDEKRPAEKNE